MKRRRRLPALTQLEIVQQGIRGEKTVAELCVEYDVSQAAYYKWKRKYEAGEYASYLSTKTTEPAVLSAGLDSILGLRGLMHIIEQQARRIQSLENELRKQQQQSEAKDEAICHFVDGR